MIKIKFGTDGWRAIIADEFTVENVKRVAAGTLSWLRETPLEKSIVVGYDCRFGGKLFAETAARVFASNGIKVYISTAFVSTPMVSLATKHLNAGCGVIITASHNPPSYNGYKLKGNYGGPSLPETVEIVENLVPANYEGNLPEFEQLLKEEKIVYFNMEDLYVEHAQKSFDLDAIHNSKLNIAYDAMYGAGQNVVRRLLPQVKSIHDEFNPSFKGQAPEPILKNLQPLVNFIEREDNIDFAFATDGDADRIGVLDGQGRFIDSHHLILMLVNYLNVHKGLKGKVVNSFSCTDKIGVLCKKLGLENTVTKIGFKYICSHMIEEDVLVGGEESGGIAVKNHIPERDGVWIALTLLEYMAKSGKTLDDLIQEIYDVTGTFSMERYDLHVNEDVKNKIVTDLKNGVYKQFGPYKVSNTQDLDGFKFILGSDGWVMIRPSGTEPVLRIYAEAKTYNAAVDILDATKARLFE